MQSNFRIDYSLGLRILLSIEKYNAVLVTKKWCVHEALPEFAL